MLLYVSLLILIFTTGNFASYYSGFYFYPINTKLERLNLLVSSKLFSYVITENECPTLHDRTDITFDNEACPLRMENFPLKRNHSSLFPKLFADRRRLSQNRRNSYE